MEKARILSKKRSSSRMDKLAWFDIDNSPKAFAARTQLPLSPQFNSDLTQNLLKLKNRDQVRNCKILSLQRNSIKNYPEIYGSVPVVRLTITDKYYGSISSERFKELVGSFIRDKTGTKENDIYFVKSDDSSLYTLVINAENLVNAKRIKDILSENKQILMSVLKDQNNFKVEISIPGGKIYDLVDPSRAITYQYVSHWVPATVGLKNDKICFTSEISGIYYFENQTLYMQLGQLLTEMRPLFEKLDCFIGRTVNKVVVKSQIYEFENYEEYIGQMHKEGIEEDAISAIGLYFPHIDSGIIGGDFKVSTQLDKRCGNKYLASEYIQVSTGTAIVVDNTTCYHHVDHLTGCGSRLVVAFFVLNAELAGKVSGSDEIIVNMEKKALFFLMKMEEEVKIRLQQHIRDMIVKYVVGFNRAQKGYEGFLQQRMRKTRNPDLDFHFNRMD